MQNVNKISEEATRKHAEVCEGMPLPEAISINLMQGMAKETMRRMGANFGSMMWLAVMAYNYGRADGRSEERARRKERKARKGSI